MFKIILSGSGKNTILVNDLEELRIVLKKLRAGDPFIICLHGIFNPSYMIGIIEDKEAEKQSLEAERLGMKTDKNTSPFAKLLAPQKKMIDDVGRSEVKVEVAKEERKTK